MPNRDIEEAKRYHEAAKRSCHGILESTPGPDWDHGPFVSKVYHDLSPVPLPRDLPPLETDALEAVGRAECNEDKAPALEELSQILAFSTGTPYAIEIYLVATDIPGLEAGVYHFNPADFSLTRLRSGDHRPELVRAAGDNQAIAAAPVTLVLSARFQPYARKYQARGYRACLWQCGTSLADLLAVAAAEGLPCSMELGFLDLKVDHLLGLDGNTEASLALVPIGRCLEWARHAGSDEMVPVSHRVAPLAEGEMDDPAVQRIHAASNLLNDEEIRPWRGPCLRLEGEKEDASLLLQGIAEMSIPLGELIRGRPAPSRLASGAMSFSQLSTILCQSTRGIPADFLEGPETSLLDLYLVAHGVDGLDPGAYYLRHKERRLELLKVGSFHREMTELCVEQPLAADAGAVVFFLSDLNRVLGRFGNRGYRAAHLEAGIIGGKLDLSACAIGFSTRALTLYDDEVVRFFSPHSRGQDAIFGMALGRAAQ